MIDANARDYIRSQATRILEIRAAVAASPGLEIGAAYKKWKAHRGEPVEMLLSDAAEPLRRAVQDLAARLRERPCSKAGCGGSQYLEVICSGCIEGRAGYKTKWTCRKCLHRDLSKESMEEWMLKLSSS